MSRYTGPRVKKMRALNLDLPGLTRKSMWDRPFPPGVHGAKNVRRRKMSDYKKQLLEKQKLRLNYGLTERQFRRLYKEAVSSRDPSGDKLLELLERRLDNAVFRAGFAPTIPAARQLINHGHFQINGKRVDIPSYRVKPGEVISLRPRSQELVTVAAALGDLRLTRPEWLEYQDDKKTASIKELPKADSVPFPVEVNLVIEYYSKRL
ncbi:MAG: 30S ribosomal protein S4 [Polyangiales bacterium]|nr:30S ribosomal protein S4 [Myxococcales bacterium]MCB9656126.1 30S ribosomal protein S4 [Sandaracinaceae bacterium]